MTEPSAVERTVISDPEGQIALWFLGALAQVRLGGEQTGGAHSLVENLVRRGTGSPVHVHDREDETFFVLDGELRVLVGDEEHRAVPGTVAVLPRRLPMRTSPSPRRPGSSPCTSPQASSGSPPRSAPPPPRWSSRRNRTSHRIRRLWSPPGTTSRSWRPPRRRSPLCPSQSRMISAG